MKKGKEISIKSNKNYTVYSGTLNNKIAKTIYLNISGWGEPKLDNEINYERVIRELRKRISQHIFNNLSESDFKKNKELFNWIYNCYQSKINIVSICVGAFVLGYVGLLNHINCTTHFQLTAELQKKFPKALVKENVLFQIDKNDLN
jgi:transcriptional regulator GlxA family with amidase domain